MIEVRYIEDESGYTLSVDGHAGYAKRGGDIICAACSGVTYALLAFLEEHPEQITSVSEQIVEPGRFRLSCNGTEQVATAFHMALLGLKKISSEYPNHVNFT